MSATLLISLAVVTVVLGLPLLAAALREPLLLAIAVRNIIRRRGEAVLVVAGALLGTAIITSAFVVGDVFDGSTRDVARSQLGPVDITVTPADEADLGNVVAGVQAADIGTIDGLLTVRTATTAIAAPGSDAILPNTLVMEVDTSAARAFGGDRAATGLADLPGEAQNQGILLNDRTADQLAVAAGDDVVVHAYGGATPLPVADVVPEVGLAGFAGAIVAPGFFDHLASTTSTAAAPPRAQLLVSLDGGIFDTGALSDDAVEDLRHAVTKIPGVEVDDVKASVVANAERTGATFTELFGTIGAFSVLAGVLLLVNLFVMLAEERKSELGMLRALGFTRGRLTRMFALEGALYAIVAALIGAAAGIGIGWLVAHSAGGIFGLADEGLALRLVIEPMSLTLGLLTGLSMSLLTIWLTSARIARLNVIRAIRDLPEPRVRHARPRALVLGAVGVVAGAALSAAGYADSNPILMLVGVPVAAFSATPLLLRLLQDGQARMLVGTTVLGWGLAAFPLFPGVMGTVELPVFVAQGVVLTAGAVSFAATADRLWAVALQGLSSRGQALAVRLGLAYPLARRFRTSMLLGMFSLVIFTMALLAAVSTSLRAQARTFTADVRGGYDVMVDSNPAHPVDAAVLTARDEVVAVAGLARTFTTFQTSYVDEPVAWAITGFDEGLLSRDAPALSARNDGYATDAEVYRDVLADPTLAIVDDAFLQQGGPSADRLRPGDTFTVIEPATGRARKLTAAGITTSDWVFNGALVSRDLTTELFGPQAVAARHYLAVAGGVDPEALAHELDRDLLANGGDSATFGAIVEDALRQQTAFFGLLQAFLGLGLLVGIAGLGVVMVRAVRDRRHEIGMLRAIGLPTRLVRTAFLYEGGLIALQGTAIGAALGLLTARQLMTSSEAFGDAELVFTIPWLGLAVITAAPVLAALALTAWPASRAASIAPAAAIRGAD